MSFEALSTAALNDHLALFTLSPLALLLTHRCKPLSYSASGVELLPSTPHKLRGSLNRSEQLIVIINTRDALDALGLIRIRLTNRWLILRTVYTQAVLGRVGPLFPLFCDLSIQSLFVTNYLSSCIQILLQASLTYYCKIRTIYALCVVL
jgi:hypothetical protein